MPLPSSQLFSARLDSSHLSSTRPFFFNPDELFFHSPDSFDSFKLRFVLLQENFTFGFNYPYVSDIFFARLIIHCCTITSSTFPILLAFVSCHVTVCLKTNHNGTLRIQEVTEVSAKICNSAWDAVRQQSSISFNVRCFLWL